MNIEELQHAGVNLSDSMALTSFDRRDGNKRRSFSSSFTLSRRTSSPADNLPTPAPGRTGVGVFYYENDVPVMETLTLNLAMPCLTANHRLRGGLRRRAKRLAVRSSLTVTHPPSVAGQGIATSERTCSRASERPESNITSPRTDGCPDGQAERHKS